MIKSLIKLWLRFADWAIENAEEGIPKITDSKERVKLKEQLFNVKCMRAKVIKFLESQD